MSLPGTRGFETWTYNEWCFGFTVSLYLIQVYAFGRTVEWRFA